MIVERAFRSHALQGRQLSCRTRRTHVTAATAKPEYQERRGRGGGDYERRQFPGGSSDGGGFNDWPDDRGEGGDFGYGRGGGRGFRGGRGRGGRGQRDGQQQRGGRYGNQGGQDRERGQGQERGPNVNWQLRGQQRAVSERVKMCNNFADLHAILMENLALIDNVHIAEMMMQCVRMLQPPERNQPPPTLSDDDRAALEKLVGNLYALILQEIGKFRGRDLGRCMYAMAKMGYFNEQVVTALVSKAQENWQDLSGLDTSNLIYGLGKMGVSPGTEWLSAYLVRSREVIQEYRMPDVANIVNSMVALGHQPDPAWTAAAAQQMCGYMGGAKVADLAVMIYGFGQLGANPGEVFLSAACIELERNVSFMKGQDVVSIFWAFAQLEYRPAPTFVAKVLDRFAFNITWCSTQQLSEVIYSVAYLQMQPTDNFLTSFYKQVLYKLREFQPSELANVVLAVATMGLRPADRWMDDVTIELKARVVNSQMSAEDLQKVVQALPLLGSGVRLSEVVNQANMLLQSYEATLQAGAYAGEVEAAEGGVYAEEAAAEPGAAAAVGEPAAV